MLYGDWVGRWGDSHPQAEALVDIPGNRRYSYADLRDDVCRMATFLSSGLSIRKGDRVAVLSLNRAEYIILFLAAGRIGAVLVPLNGRLAVEELPYYLADASPVVVFFDKDNRAAAAWLKRRIKGPRYVSFDEFTRTREGLPNARPDDVPLSANDPQLILYTSGTTGSPKGVILTHGMTTWNSINTNIGWGLYRGERTILHSALFYTAGWNVFTLPLFHSLGTNVLIDRFDADLVLDLIERERITVFFAVPTMFQMMIDSPKFEATDFSNVWLILSGGAPLPKSIIDTFRNRKGVRLREGYGLTEAGPNNFMADGKPGTVGYPMPHVDIRLVDGEGKDAPPGKQGELLLKGDHVSPGYWNKPEATAEAIREGWFHTGDIAGIDEDGHISIVGRKKDMLISGGVNIYPAEIEPVIASHPGVAAAAVIGVPDEKWGEVGKAIVELKPGGSLTLSELQSYLSRRIGKFKIPKYMVIVDALPRTLASAKVQKSALRERYGRADNR